jgi:hypothetical protein
MRGVFLGDENLGNKKIFFKKNDIRSTGIN